MDVVFLGSGAFGIPTLERLADEHTITGIVTQPDRPAGRKKVLTPTPIGAWAAEHLPGVPILKPENINTDQPRDEIRSWRADAWVVIAYGQYLGSKLIKDRFAINLHASLLPRWRGAAPINAAMVAGDRVTGNSVITIAKKMDAGLILGQSERSIEPDQTMGELHDLLANDGPDLIMRVLDDHAHNRVEYLEQDESLVTVAGKLTKSMARINWSKSADELACWINGLSPRPGAFTTYQGKTIRILRAIAIHDPTDLAPHIIPRWKLGMPISSFNGPKARREHGYEPGAIIDGLFGLVWTGQGALRILSIQPPNKPTMSWKAFANGFSLRKQRSDVTGCPRFHSEDE